MLKLANKAILLAGIITLAVSCSGRPKNVLSASKMTDILTDLHKLEGTLSAANIPYDRFDQKSQYYNAVLEKHGITQAQFDSSVVWYTHNPKKYEHIYDDVLVRLEKLNEEVKKGKYHSVDSTDLKKAKLPLWVSRTRYEFRKDSARTRLHFEIRNRKFMYRDVYILSFKHFIAREDSSTNPHIVVRIHYANGKVDSVYRKTSNDNIMRHYTFRIPATRKLKVRSISGELLGSTAYKGKFHATVDSVSLTRMFDPAIQDSLLKVVQKAGQRK